MCMLRKKVSGYRSRFTGIDGRKINRIRESSQIGAMITIIITMMMMKLGKHGWHSFLTSRIRRFMCVEFIIGSCLATRFSCSLPSRKTNTSKFQFDLDYNR